ncbi:uncharacterized protein TNCV_2417111 [Trichonephila clavipes]|nr:uncharacterized protein TNCV_2417111 [Trichonephila clavipes]
MNTRFWPSLELVAQVKFALGILCNFEFRTFHADFLDADEHIEQQCYTCIYQMLSTFCLPNKTRARIIDIIRILAAEIKIWCGCHKELLLVAELNYWNRIRWYSHGTIDYFETARTLFQDENLGLKHRFELGCKYYFESDVHMLWKNMSRDDRVFLWKNIKMTNCMRFWMHALRTDGTLDWSQISLDASTGYLIRRYSARSFFFGNYLGLLYYFRKLENPEARFQYLSLAILSRSIKPFYLYLCLILMEDCELDSMFIRLTDFQRYILFESFLRWPLQDMFSDIIQRFQNNVSSFVYLELFKFILCEKIEREWLDIEYISLVKNLWTSLPENIKSVVEQDCFYPCLKACTKSQ